MWYHRTLSDNWRPAALVKVLINVSSRYRFISKFLLISTSGWLRIFTHRQKKKKELDHFLQLWVSRTWMFTALRFSVSKIFSTLQMWSLFWHAVCETRLQLCEAFSLQLWELLFHIRIHTFFADIANAIGCKKVNQISVSTCTKWLESAQLYKEAWFAPTRPSAWLTLTTNTNFNSLENELWHHLAPLAELILKRRFCLHIFLDITAQGGKLLPEVLPGNTAYIFPLYYKSTGWMVTNLNWWRCLYNSWKSYTLGNQGILKG